jgi:hypothetical protein
MSIPLHFSVVVKGSITAICLLSLFPSICLGQLKDKSNSVRELPAVQSNSQQSKADKVSLNPQPLPPKQNAFRQNPGDKVSLNPQPLPPKQGVVKLQQGEKQSKQGPLLTPATSNAAPKSALSR